MSKGHAVDDAATLLAVDSADRSCFGPAVVTWEIPDERGRVAVSTKSTAAWKAKAVAAYMDLCRSGREFTADDHRRLVPESPGSNENARGGVFQAGARRGHAVTVGWAPSCRKEAHSRNLRIWRGTDHPDLRLIWTEKV